MSTIELTEAAIADALARCKSWMAGACRDGDALAVAEFKVRATELAERARREGLNTEHQLDALETVRRAERGLGLAIRRGQELGVIAKTGDIGGYMGTGRDRTPRGGDLLRPAEIAGVASPSGLSAMYAAADDVTDDEYEAALAKARAEGEMTRVNVRRKLVENGSLTLSPSEKVDLIRELASIGHSSRQIGPRIGWSEEHIRRQARKFAIDIPADRITRGAHRVDPERVVRETVHALEGLAQGLGLLSPEDYDDLDSALMSEWRGSLNQSLRSVRNLVKELSKRV